MVLDKIVASTKKALAGRKRPLAELDEMIARQAAPRDFAAALSGKGIRLIAEVKRASPSRGDLSPDLDAASLARTYRAAGAAAISVLTEAEHFKGSLDDLAAVRQAVDLPLLRKDFIIDPYQVYEARAHGADAVLLIAAILSDADMRSLLAETRFMGMEALVEVHSRDDLRRALALGPRMVGINNRNLADFTVSLETTIELRPLVPDGMTVVSESGIHSREDVLRLEQAGVHAILVGEALVTSPDPAGKIAQLLGRP